MKKVMMTLLLVAAFGVNGFAQKGMNGVGVKLFSSIGGYKPEKNYSGYTSKSNMTFGVGLEYQYFATDDIRIKPSVAFFTDQAFNISKFSAQVAADYLFPVSSRFKPYLNFSLRYADHNAKGHMPDEAKGILYGGGAGLDFRFGYHFSMQIEAVALFGAKGRSSNYDGVVYPVPKTPNIVPSLGLIYTF